MTISKNLSQEEAQRIQEETTKFSSYIKYLNKMRSSAKRKKDFEKVQFIDKMSWTLLLFDESSASDNEKLAYNNICAALDRLMNS